MMRTTELDYLTRRGREDYLEAIKKNDLQKAQEIVESGLDLELRSSSLTSTAISYLRNHLRSNNHEIVEHFVDTFSTQKAFVYHSSSLCTTAIENQAYHIASKVIDNMTVLESQVYNIAQTVAAEKSSRPLQAFVHELEEKLPEFNTQYKNALLHHACKQSDQKEAQRLQTLGAVLKFSATTKNKLNEAIRKNKRKEDTTTNIMIDAFNLDHGEATSLINLAMRSDNHHALTRILDAKWPISDRVLQDVFEYAISEKTPTIASKVTHLVAGQERPDTDLTKQIYILASCHGMSNLIAEQETLFAEVKKDKRTEAEIAKYKITNNPRLDVQKTLTQADGSITSLPSNLAFQTMRERLKIEMSAHNSLFLLETQDFKSTYFASHRETERLIQALDKNDHLSTQDKTIVATKLYDVLKDTPGMKAGSTYTKHAIEMLKSQTRDTQKKDCFLLEALPQLDEEMWVSNVTGSLFTSRDLVKGSNEKTLKQIIDKMSHMDGKHICKMLPYLISEKQDKAALHALEASAEHLKLHDLLNLQLENDFEAGFQSVRTHIQAIISERMYSDAETKTAKLQTAYDYISAHSRSITVSDIGKLSLSLGINGDFAEIPTQSPLGWSRLPSQLIDRENYDAVSYLVKNGMPIKTPDLYELIKKRPASDKRLQEDHLTCFRIMCSHLEEFNDSNDTSRIISRLSSPFLPVAYYETIFDKNILDHVHSEIDIVHIQDRVETALQDEQHDNNSVLAKKLRGYLETRAAYLEDKKQAAKSQRIIHVYSQDTASEQEQDFLKQHLSGQFARISKSQKPLLSAQDNTPSSPERTSSVRRRLRGLFR